jgi:hypothetical protein
MFVALFNFGGHFVMSKPKSSIHPSSEKKVFSHSEIKTSEIKSYEADFSGIKFNDTPFIQ